MERGGGHRLNSNPSNQYLYPAGHRKGVLGSKSDHSVGVWQKTTPALLKTSEDFGGSFIERQRQNRLIANAGRARSEVGEVLANGGGANRMNSSFIHRRDTSFDTDNRHIHRASSVYERPRSSYQLTAPPSANQRLIMRQRDDWMEVGHKNQFSSEDDIEDEEYLSGEDEEVANYNSRRGYERGVYREFDEDDIYYFGVVQLNVRDARRIVKKDPPPDNFWTFKAEEKTAYLYYYMLYKRYITPIKKFYNIFNREFFKYTSEGLHNKDALLKICQHTKSEFDAYRQTFNKQAYDRSRKHLFSDDRATPESRASDRPSVYEALDESDLASVDSGIREPRKFNKPHAFASFGVGGKLVLLNPEFSINTIFIEDVRDHVVNPAVKRNIEAMAVFKGPLLVGETQSHAPLLFIEQQIRQIKNSEIYRQNSDSSDANDCLLIWELLEMLVRQRGLVSGPDLARLLIKPDSKSKQKRNRVVKDAASKSDSPIYALKDERRVDSSAIDLYTDFLLNGFVDEAIDSAIKHGLLFDALMLAHRVYGHDEKDRQKLEQFEGRLLAFRNPQHPTMTLLSVASEMPVPILNNMSSVDDPSGWRSHAAIVLANFATDAAIKTVYELGLALSKKEFNAAADFCFLAVYLLKANYNCFAPPEHGQNDDEESFRRHISLINASLPDDEYYSTQTPYGWSITDFQATEIFDFAIQSQKVKENGLKYSNEYQQCRLQYAQLMAEYGSFSTPAYKYCQSIANSISDRRDLIEPTMLMDLCNLGERLAFFADQKQDDVSWIESLRSVVAVQTTQNAIAAAQHSQQQQQYKPPEEFHLQREAHPVESTTVTTSSSNRTTVETAPLSPVRAAVPVVAATVPVNESRFAPVVEPPFHGQHSEPQSAHTLDGDTRFNFMPQEPVKSYEFSNNFQNYPPTSMPSHQFLDPEDDQVVTSTPVNTFIEEHEESPRRSSEYDLGGSVLSPSSQYEFRQIPNAAPASFVPANAHLPPAQEYKHAEPEPQRMPAQQQPIQNFQPNYTSSTAPQSQHQPQFGGGMNDTKPKEIPQTTTSKQSKEGQKGGIFSGFKDKLAKLIPAPNQMILPDDSSPSIVWNAELQKYVGAGIEKPPTPPPPPPGPQMPSQMPFNPTAPTQNAAPMTRPNSRRPGGRYANPFANSQTAGANVAAPENLGMMISSGPPPGLPQFGFIPAPSNDDEEGVNPFSDGPTPTDPVQQQ